METKKKYRLTDESIIHEGRTLYRIEALVDFSNIKAGTKGGFVESERNLSHDGACWVFGNAIVFDGAAVFGNALVYYGAMVFENAQVYDDAQVFCDARVFGNAQVFGDARVFGNARVFGDAEVCGNARVFGDAVISNNAIVRDDADYIVFKNWWSSGRFFTWTRSNNMWEAGCFSGTGEQLIGKAYHDSELSGREYERVVNYVKSILEET